MQIIKIINGLRSLLTFTSVVFSKQFLFCGPVWYFCRVAVIGKKERKHVNILYYGLENALLTENTLHKIHVVWNNYCFRHILFRCCWRESVRPLQQICKSLPLSYLIDQTKSLFWKKMYISSNVILYYLSRFVVCTQSAYVNCQSIHYFSSATDRYNKMSCLFGLGDICRDTQLLILLLCVLL